MKKKMLAFGLSAMMLASLPLNGLTAFAEPIPPDAPVPDWVPTDFWSAMEFSNQYGATHIADGRICILLRQENDDNYKYDLDITQSGDWECEPCSLYRDVTFVSAPKPEAPPENTKEYYEYEQMMRELEYLQYDEATDSYVTPFGFRMLVYEMNPECTLKITPKISYKNVEHSGKTYEFVSDRDGNITETDIYRWVPDCMAEFSAYKQEHNSISLFENYIVYCGNVNYSADMELEITKSGTARLELVSAGHIQSNRLMMLAGEPEHFFYVYRALNNGLAKLTAATFLRHGETPEEQHRKEESEYFGVTSPDEIIIIDPGQYTEPVPCDCNNDRYFTIADVVMLTKYLLGSGEIYFWTLADLDENNILNAADLSLMKQKLLTSVNQEEEPKLGFKGDQQVSWFFVQEGETIKVPYSFYVTIPKSLLTRSVMLDFRIYDADTDRKIGYQSSRQNGNDGSFVLTVNMDISQSETRRYYAVVEIEDISNPKPELLHTLKSDVFEWNIEVSREIPVPPAG